MDIKDIEPIGNRVVLQPEEEETIVLLEGKQPKDRCTVVAVGPGNWAGDQRLPLQVKVGDLVLIGGVVEEFKLNNNDTQSYYVLPETSIKCILNREQFEKDQEDIKKQSKVVI